MTQRNLAAEKPMVSARLRQAGLQGMRDNRPIFDDAQGTEHRLAPEILDQLKAPGYKR